MVHVTAKRTGADIQIGDYINKAGIYTKPGVVTEKKEDGTVVIDTSDDAIKTYHRHTNTSGLTPEEKSNFNAIMDEIMVAGDNGERINKLQEKIQNLKSDPNSKKVLNTLRNEQAALIRASRELPRVYAYDSEKIR